MIRYTKSATLDTLDFIKRIIYYSDIIIQFSYILYVAYRLYFNMGTFFMNVILIIITGGYFIYYLVTKREFYSENLKKQRKVVREVVKWVKRVIYIYLIGVSLYALAFAPTTNDNMAILMTLLMIVGFMFSFVFDLIIKEINSRIALLGAAALYDLEQFTIERSKTTKALKLLASIDLEAAPKVVDKTMIARLHKVDDEQNKKAERKKDFFELLHLRRKKSVEDEQLALTEKPKNGKK